MKYMFIVVLFCLTLTGCDYASIAAWTSNGMLPLTAAGLTDCVGGIVTANRYVYVIRCPNSSVSTQRTISNGKSSHSEYDVTVDNNQPVGSKMVCTVNEDRSMKCIPVDVE